MFLSTKIGEPRNLFATIIHYRRINIKNSERDSLENERSSASNNNSLSNVCNQAIEHHRRQHAISTTPMLVCD